MNVCDYFLKNYQNLSDDGDAWVQRMRSSFSNFDKKFVYGNSYDFGDFDSCISTKVDALNVVGKHCMIKFQSKDVIGVNPPSSLRNLKWKNIDVSFGGAVCVPNECGKDAIKYITDQLFNGTTLTLSTDYEQEDFCQVEKSINIKFGDYLLISLILLYILTIFYITWRTKGRKSNTDLLSSFSLTSSLKSLFEVESSSFYFLKPIRAILYMGLVQFHSVFVRAYFPLSNSEKMLKFEEGSYSKIVSTFPFALTGFFVISSVLTTKKMLELLDKKSFNFFVMLIDRYTRIVIVVAALVFVNIFVNGLELYQAPYYFPDQASKECREYWWTTLLLIQNYYHPTTSQMCLPQCWFLSANFQFFLLTPLVIYPIWRWKKSVFFIIPALLGMSQGIIFLFAMEHNQFLKQTNFFAITHPKFAKYYLHSHYLASAWIIGMLVGVLFHRCKKLEMNLAIKSALISFIIFMFFKLFGWKFVFESTKPSIFLFTIDRLLLALFAASVLMLCNYWDGGKKNSRSAPKKPNIIWVAIDNVGLSLYVVHSAVIIASTVIRKQAQTFDMVHIYIDNVSDFMLSFECAILLYLFVEIPFRKVIKKLLMKRFRQSKVTDQVLNDFRV
ncbi:hypothetical protein ACKWTF_004147 [Chironomus riparius]